MDILQDFLRTSDHTAWVEVGADARITDANPTFARYGRSSIEQLIGHDLSEFLTDPELIGSWTNGGALPEEPIWLNFAGGGGDRFSLRCLVARTDRGVQILGEPELDEERSTADELMRLTSELGTMMRERDRRQRELEQVRAKLQATVDELQASYWHLRKIQEVLPVCMACDKVKTGEAHWESVVDYLKQNEIFLSHGYCPECGEAMLREHGLA